MPVSPRPLPGLLAALSLLTFSGCAWLPQSDAEGTMRTSGLMHLTEDGGRLETCAGPEHPLKVDAELRALFERVAEPAQTVMFVDLRGELLADGSLRPVTVLRMDSNGNGCADQVAKESQWVAVGERPDWLVRIAPEGLQMTTLGEQWQSIITERLPDNTLAFRSLEGEPVELWVYPQPCFSRLDGHYYQRSVRLLTAGESFAGCAYPGQLARDELSDD